MTGEALGYSVSLFGGKNSNFHGYAIWADKKENGGNGNHLIDTEKEVELFKKYIKDDYNYDFSFDNIKKAHREKLEWCDKYYTFPEISKDYKASDRETLAWLNQKGEIRDFGGDINMELLQFYKDNGFQIANMSEEDYKQSVEAIHAQIKAIEQRDIKIEQEQVKKTETLIAKINKAYGEQYQVTANEVLFKDSTRTVTIVLKGSKTLGQIKEDFQLSDGVLIANNPHLKKGTKQTFWEKLTGNRDLDKIMITNQTFKLPVDEIHL